MDRMIHLALNSLKNLRVDQRIISDLCQCMFERCTQAMCDVLYKRMYAHAHKHTPVVDGMQVLEALHHGI